MVWCVVNSTETKHSFRCYGLSLSEKRWCLRFSKCAWKSLMSVNILYSRFLLAILSRMCEYWYLSKHIWRTPQTPHMHSHTHTNFCYQHKSHDIGCVERRRAQFVETQQIEFNMHNMNVNQVEGNTTALKEWEVEESREAKTAFWLCPSMFHHLIWYFHYNHEMHNIHFDFTDKNRKCALGIVVFTVAAWLDWKKLMAVECWTSTNLTV